MHTSKSTLTTSAHPPGEECFATCAAGYVASGPFVCTTRERSDAFAHGGWSDVTCQPGPVEVRASMVDIIDIERGNLICNSIFDFRYRDCQSVSRL